MCSAKPALVGTLKRARLPSVAPTRARRLEQRIVDAYRRAGIAIFDPITGSNLAGTQGIVIAPRARLSVFHHAPPTVQNVAGFIRDNSGILARAPYVLGLWGEAGKHLLDVCVVIAELEEALQFLEDSRQRCCWKLAGMSADPRHLIDSN